LISQYVQINRKKYAVGLLWQPSVSGVTTRAYAARLAHGIDRKANLYIGYNSMVGLGARSRGHRSGMPSLAAEILNSLSEYSSFLGVFQVDKKFVLIAVRNGIILQDLLFTDEVQARQKYSELTEIPDWGALFAPAVWGMPRAIDRNLSDIVSGNVRSVLRPISRVGVGMLSLLMLVLFGFAMLYFFREPINQILTPKKTVATLDPELAMEYKRQIEEKNKELDKQYNMHQEPEIEPLVMPYEVLPDTAERANVCYKGIAFLMQPVTGWNQTSVECSETHVVARFRRSFGTLDSFYAVAGELMPGAFVQEISDEEVMVRAKLPEVPTVKSQDSRDADSIIRELVSRFQGINITPTTNAVVDVVSNQSQSAEIYLVELGVETKLIPSEFLNVLDGFDGVYITKVTWDIRRKIWNYEVIIYAK